MRIVVFVCAVAMSLSATPKLLASAFEEILSDHKMALTQHKSMGGRYFAYDFPIERIFHDLQTTGSLNKEVVRLFQAQIALAKELGIVPVGTMSSWEFPSFINAPRLPPAETNLYFTETIRSHCIPPFEDLQYRELSLARNELFALLIGAFPEVNHWLVGPEPHPEFTGCDGSRLDLARHLSFVNDTIRGVTNSIRKLDPDATIIIGFLGLRTSELNIGGDVLQPSVLQSLVIERLEEGGWVHSNNLTFVSELDPTILLDRIDEVEPMTMGASTLSVSGWNAKRVENFSTNAADLVESYADWVQWRTDEDSVFLTVTGVQNGSAILSLTTPPGDEDTSITKAGRSVPGPETDYIPIEELDCCGSSGSERHKWTVVNDFFPVSQPAVPGAHAAVFLRVVDRVWNNSPDQTRLGSIIFGPITKDAAQCVGQGGSTTENLAAFQLTGDDLNNPGQGKTNIYCFVLDHNPFSNPTQLYRTQLIEREAWHFMIGWRLQWRAEVWTDSTLIGARGWRTGVVGIGVPDLTEDPNDPTKDSRIAFGFGPGVSGRIDSDLVGSAYWVY